jgi:hypothetical protein
VYLLESKVKLYEGRLKCLEFLSGMWPVIGLIVTPPGISLQRALGVFRRHEVD